MVKILLRNNWSDQRFHSTIVYLIRVNISSSGANLMHTKVIQTPTSKTLGEVLHIIGTWPNVKPHNTYIKTPDLLLLPAVQAYTHKNKK